MPKLFEFLTAWIVGGTLAVSAFAHLEEPYGIHFACDAITATKMWRFIGMGWRDGGK